ncbi:MAG: alanine racemase [Anaerolineaceae bacterium]|nr:alanine racemase [Anaerolineaceae bacterium]
MLAAAPGHRYTAAMCESASTLPPGTTTWLEIDQSAIRSNLRTLRGLTGPQTRLMAIIKAEAYGHGAPATARSVLAAGAQALGVASLGEALELREAGIDAPILLLSYVPPRAVPTAIELNLTLTLFDAAQARACDQAARATGRRLKAQVKLDSGMGRMGTLEAEAPALQEQLADLSWLQLEGCYTHFAQADEDCAWTREQLRRFLAAVAAMRQRGAQFSTLHSANSAATLALPESHLDLVRPGIALYGLSPSDTVPLPSGFRPALTWKTQVVQLRDLPAGHSVGYGRTWTAASATRMAVLPVGYEHGYRRAPHESASVLLRGQVAPVIGRISMEKTTIDVSSIPGAQVGDEVVLLGRQGKACISAEMLAARFGSNNYEVVTGLSARMPRLQLSTC